MRPRILMLCSRVPYPPIGGDRLRVLNVARILRQHYDVDLLALSAWKVPASSLDALRQLFNHVEVFEFPRHRYVKNAVLGSLRGLPAEVAAFDFPEVREWLESNADLYDLGWCHLVRMAQYVDVMPERKVIDMADAISSTYYEASRNTAVSFPRRLFYLSQRGRVLKTELQAFRDFDLSYVHTGEDRDYLRAKAWGATTDNKFSRLSVSPMGIPTEFMDMPTPASQKAPYPVIGFVGKMDYYPNEDAAVWFAEKIFSLVCREIVRPAFLIIGANPSKRVRRLERLAGVQVLGHVENLTETLANCTITVAPMRICGGIQNKVIQSMALGVPVIGTRLAFRGTGIMSADLEAETAQGIAGNVVLMLQDHKRRAEHSSRMRTYIRERFSWDSIGRDLLADLTGDPRYDLLRPVSSVTGISGPSSGQDP
jgi:glycosyltransferase involved in cell wall biosynthesis